MTLIRAPLMVLSLLLLAGCGGDAEIASDDDGRSATGEVLDGSVSDAMLPVEQTRSQPPLMEPEATATGTGGAAPTTDEGLPEGAVDPIRPLPEGEAAE